MGTPTTEATGYDKFLDGDHNVYDNYIHSEGPWDTNSTINCVAHVLFSLLNPCSPRTVASFRDRLT